MKHFRKLVLLRIVILTVLLACGIYYFFVEEKMLRSIYLFVFALLAIAEFYWFVDRINRNTANFLTALMQNDFTTTFATDGHNRSFRQLHESFNQITFKFKELTAAREARHQYLEALVSHIRVGIVSYDASEKIMLLNQAFLRMVGKQSLGFLHGLEMVDLQLLTSIRQLKPGESRTLSITINNELLQLNIHKTAFQELGEQYMLVSLQNIRQALSIHEIQAWQKLMRVLTHEIMNSISPITSLSETLIGLTQREEQPVEILKQGLEAIHARSSGLEAFTIAYRQLTGLPAPKIRPVTLEQLIVRIIRLLQADSDVLPVTTRGRDDLIIQADPDLLGQVFINLIRNAVDATKRTESPEILIQWERLENGTEIKVADNGSGIDPDKLENIFVPFYTTKKDGSGIGLAVSQQIIQMHEGTLDVQSRPGETVFRILLPAKISPDSAPAETPKPETTG